MKHHVDQNAIMKLCSICVNTYKRPELLSQLLESLAHQVHSDEVLIEIIVVDNDAQEAGRAVVQEYTDSTSLSIRYFTESVKNISLARNKAVSEANGAYILFIDDDEQASPDWVQKMVDALENHLADAAFGRVLPVFNSEAPEWIKSIYIYHLPCGPTGMPAVQVHTSNAIVRAHWLHSEKQPFDPEYGLTGGEDADLFRRLARKGAKLINCFEGVVTEFKPPDRTRPEWLINRAYRTGVLYTRNSIALARNRWILTLYLFAKAIALYLISLALSIISLYSKSRRFHYRLKMSAYSGHIMGIFGNRMIGY